MRDSLPLVLSGARHRFPSARRHHDVRGQQVRLPKHSRPPAPHSRSRRTVHRRRWKVRRLAGTSRGREWVREVPQCGRPGFDPRGAVRTSRRRRRHHSLAPDQIARGDNGRLTRQRVGRGDATANPFSGCCRSISTRRRICNAPKDGSNRANLRAQPLRHPSRTAFHHPDKINRSCIPAVAASLRRRSHRRQSPADRRPLRYASTM